MGLILGIDEAGRGPVIGPMVMCGFGIDENKIDELIKSGAKDSKQMTAKAREAIYDYLLKIADKVIIKRISPRELDRTNINTIEKNITAEIINKSNPDTVYIDVPVRGKYICHYVDEVKSKISSQDVKIIGANKADSLYPAVSAASIIAKVERDRDIKNLHEIYGDFGSGYPGDKYTVKFLEKYYADNKSLPECARLKWKTSQCIMQESLFDLESFI